jgi:hypothetical protein
MCDQSIFDYISFFSLSQLIMSRRYQSQKKPIRKAKRNQPTLKQSAESHPWLTSFEQQSKSNYNPILSDLHGN